MAARLEALLTVDDVAQLAQVSVETVRRDITAGALPALKIRGRLRIRPDDFEGWIERYRIGAIEKRPTRKPRLRPPDDGPGGAERLLAIEDAA